MEAWMDGGEEEEEEEMDKNNNDVRCRRFMQYHRGTEEGDFFFSATRY